MIKTYVSQLLDRCSFQLSYDVLYFLILITSFIRHFNSCTRSKLVNYEHHIHYSNSKKYSEIIIRWVLQINLPGLLADETLGKKSLDV